MQYYSVIILAILLPQSHGSVQNPSRSIRGSSIESITNMQQPQLATQGGCMKNSECPDDYYCHVDDGDCLSGNILGECYEMTARRTRSLRNVSPDMTLLQRLKCLF